MKQRDGSINESKYQQPVPVVERNWIQINVIRLQFLIPSSYYNSILNVVDRHYNTRRASHKRAVAQLMRCTYAIAIFACICRARIIRNGTVHRFCSHTSLCSSRVFRFVEKCWFIAIRAFVVLRFVYVSEVVMLTWTLNLESTFEGFQLCRFIVIIMGF